MKYRTCTNCHTRVSKRNKSGLCRSCAKLGSNSKNLSKSLLFNYYIKQQKSLRVIGKLINCDGTTVLRYLKLYKIPRRKIAVTNAIRPFTKTTRLKIAKKAKERLKNPKNNPNYKSYLSEKDRTDRRLSPNYKNWIQEVLKVNNYTCQVCLDKTGGNLEVHHLESYHWCKELRTDLNNSICICSKCHIKFHKKFGYLYNTTEQFIKFIKQEKNYGPRKE